MLIFNSELQIFRHKMPYLVVLPADRTPNQRIAWPETWSSFDCEDPSYSPPYEVTKIDPTIGTPIKYPECPNWVPVLNISHWWVNGSTWLQDITITNPQETAVVLKSKQWWHDINKGWPRALSSHNVLTSSRWPQTVLSAVPLSSLAAHAFLPMARGAVSRIYSTMMSRSCINTLML